MDETRKELSDERFGGNEEMIEKKIEKYLKEKTDTPTAAWKEIHKIMKEADGKISDALRELDKDIKNISYEAKLVLADETSEFWYWVRKQGYIDEDEVLEIVQDYGYKLQHDPKLKKDLEKYADEAMSDFNYTGSKYHY